jgi:NADPH:quinone reductase-like Zn-dependent oxidoreductase
MKAIVYTKYGSPDVLHLEEVTKPALDEEKVLVRVNAASIHAADWHMLTGDPFIMRLMGVGLFKPKNTILGADMAGCVETVGRKIKQFRPGDTVFGDVFGLGSGSLAEYVSVPESALVPKPSNVSFEEAAAVPAAALTALQGLRNQGHIQPGQKVLINGASGGVGTFAVQIAKAFGAEVTAVCSTRNLEMARSIGADHVIDYTKEDFTQNGQQYDLILASNGYHPLSAYWHALTPQGIYVFSGGSPAQTFQSLFLGPLMSQSPGRKMKSVMKRASHEDLLLLGKLLEDGKIRPVVEACYPLSRTAEAFRYFGEGHARGKVVITMAEKTCYKESRGRTLKNHRIR